MAKSLKVILLLMSILIIGSLGYLNNFKSKIDDFFIFSKHLTKIQELIYFSNEYISNPLEYKNYDKLEEIIQKTHYEIEQVTKIKNYQELYFKNDFEDIINDIEYSHDYFERYKSYSAILNNSYRYIQTIDSEVIIRFNTIYPKLLTLTINEEIDTKNLYLDLQLLQPKTKKEKNFLVHAKLVIEYYKKLDHLMQTLSQLSLGERLIEFKNKYENYYYKLMFEIKLIFGLFILSILVLFWYLYSYSMNIKKREKILQRFRNAIEQSDNEILITDFEQKIIFANTNTLNRSGYSLDELLGKTPKMLQSGLQSESFYDELNKVIYSGNVWKGEFINKDKENNLLYEKASIVPIKDINGQIQEFMSIKLDITKEKLAEQKLITRHYFDELTKLPNKNRLIDDLDENFGVLIFLLNIDSFKEINDYYGHDVGVSLLVKTSEHLKNCGNEFNNLSVYKLNADEFYLYIKVKDSSDVFDLINKIVAKTKQITIEFDYFSIDITINIGVTFHENFKKKNIRDIFIESDLALTESKSSSVDYILYNKDAENQLAYIKNIEIVKELKKAINDNKIDIYFQPIIDLSNNQIYSYEVLVRMIDKSGEVKAPFYFLDIAKKYKIYHQVTKIVLTKAFEKFKDTDTKFSINLSFEDIYNEETQSLILELVKNHKHKESIFFEILETENINDFNKVNYFIQDFKEFGCKIYLDDFGSGYSNFVRMYKLNIDVVKLDGSIVKDIASDENLKNIAKTIIAFTKSSGLKVVAEYVHNENVLEVVKELGVDYAQGYYLAEPKPYTLEH